MPKDPRPFYSTSQRIVLLTFEDPEEAQAWDDAGQPLRLTLFDGNPRIDVFAVGNCETQPAART